MVGTYLLIWYSLFDQNKSGSLHSFQGVQIFTGKLFIFFYVTNNVNIWHRKNDLVYDSKWNPGKYDIRLK